MDKEKIVSQLQQKMEKKYSHTKIEGCYNMLALKLEGEVIAWFECWDPDDYVIQPGSKAEQVLSTDILLEFYKEGRKLLKKPIKKYRIKVLNNNYLNVNYYSDLVAFADLCETGGWRTSFTKKEIEELKKRDDIAIDWDKVELEEVDDDE